MNNQCSPSELEEMINWAKKEALNEKSREEYLEEWQNSGLDMQLDDERFIQLFDRIQHKIESDENKNSKRITPTSGLKAVTTWLTRAAAILLLPVLLFLAYTLSEKEKLNDQFVNIETNSLEVVAPLGSRTVIHLSDGTEVHLNYGSKLKYPQVFTGDTRKVELIGEGYFEVAHNPEKPFIVKAGDLNIKALGTDFNVYAYPVEKYIETTLVNGKVELKQNKENKTLGIMVPGQHIKYNKEDKTTYSTIGEVNKYVAWKDGKLIFDDTPITEVANKLSKIFNVEIEVRDNIKNYNYTVTIIDEPLFQILDLMTMAAPVKYTVFPRVKNPDGTFSRQKIILEKRK